MIKPFIYTGNQYERFLEDYSNQNNEKEKIVIDLNECSDKESYYLYFKKLFNLNEEQYKFLNMDAVGDYFQDFADNGVSAYFEVLNIKNSVLDQKFIKSLVAYLLLRAYEAVDIDKVYYSVYLDEVPEFVLEELNEFKDYLVE